jgi:hypothetical protein
MFRPLIDWAIIKLKTRRNKKYNRENHTMQHVTYIMFGGRGRMGNEISFLQIADKEVYVRKTEGRGGM